MNSERLPITALQMMNLVDNQARTNYPGLWITDVTRIAQQPYGIGVTRFKGGLYGKGRRWTGYQEWITITRIGRRKGRRFGSHYFRKERNG
jgi:hypothetical protein